jgi:tRNA 5-methylaminomethyl-2-thiouridine biosynthesis bifunctional protein
VAILGAGVAGASAARAVRALGSEAVVFDPAGVGGGASGNPAALVTPRLDAGLGASAQLFAEAFRRAVQLYEALPAAILSRGVLQLPAQPRDLERFGKIAASDLFEPGALRLREDGLLQASALVVEPEPILQAWAGEVRRERVATLAPVAEGWSLGDETGRELARVGAVIIAAGPASRDFADIKLQSVRGQVSWAPGLTLAQALAWGGYAAPGRPGLLFGATHDRDDEATDVRQADHLRNLATLRGGAPDRAGAVEAAGRLQGRASIRAATVDRLPLAGPACGGPGGLFLLTGFGSRGFAMAPLLAELVAALATGAASPLRSDLATLVEPERFRRRDRARGRS